jgi:hypothetical protein
MADTWADIAARLFSAAPDDRPALIEELHQAYLADPRATTPNGLPYPAPTDPIAQGADAIRSLAQAIDNQPGVVGIQRGTAATAASGVTQVVFPKPYSVVPVVLVTAYTSGGNVGIAYLGAAPTAAGFGVRTYTTAAAQVAGSVGWVAFPV